ncbi:hypothetical protein E5288_WYG019755 [Bos mutus]|uniref:Uncharacterized protein n=1 Tax=Bos mutus TaxID=72004 RepID=A0A6B0RRZ5_9CETA|nr:hypothetical protein [Bos mutus]
MICCTLTLGENDYVNNLVRSLLCQEKHDMQWVVGGGERGISPRAFFCWEKPGKAGTGGNGDQKAYTALFLSLKEGLGDSFQSANEPASVVYRDFLIFSKFEGLQRNTMQESFTVISPDSAKSKRITVIRVDSKQTWKWHFIDSHGLLRAKGFAWFFFISHPPHCQASVENQSSHEHFRGAPQCPPVSQSQGTRGLTLQYGEVHSSSSVGQALLYALHTLRFREQGP